MNHSNRPTVNTEHFKLLPLKLADHPRKSPSWSSRMDGLKSVSTVVKATKRFGAFVIHSERQTRLIGGRSAGLGPRKQTVARRFGHSRLRPRRLPLAFGPKAAKPYVLVKPYSVLPLTGRGSSAQCHSSSLLILKHSLTSTRVVISMVRDFSRGLSLIRDQLWSSKSATAPTCVSGCFSTMRTINS